MAGAAVGAAAGGLMGMFGSLGSAKMSQKTAKKQMGFQEYMYKRRYQMTMADMRKAGLNPILAYQQGGGAAPSGARATIPDIGASMVSGARKGAMLAQELRNLKAVERRDRKAGDLMGSQQAVAAQDQWIKRHQREILRMQIPSARAVGEYYSTPTGKWSKKWEQFRHDVGLSLPLTGRAGGARLNP